MTNALWSGLATVVAALFAIIVDKLKRDRHLLTRSQVLEDSTKHLQFIEYWIKVTVQAESMADLDARDSAKQQCKEILDNATDEWKKVQSISEVSVVGGARRVARFVDSVLSVLLISKVNRPLFWFPRLVFFFSVAMSVMLLRTSGTSLLDLRVLSAVLVCSICWTVVYRFDRPAANGMVISAGGGESGSSAS